MALSIFDLWQATLMRRVYSSTDTPTRMVLAALLNALPGQPRALELGAHVGGTSVLLRDVLAIKGGTLTLVESGERLADDLRATMANDGYQVPVEIVQRDVLDYLRSAPDDTFDFVYVDADHTPEHVAQTIDALPHVCRDTALVCFHDCYPPSDYIGTMVTKVGGTVLPIGERGLGVWCVRKT